MWGHMRVLIVEESAQLGALWTRHLERQGAEVSLATTQNKAVQALNTAHYDVLIVDLSFSDGSTLAITDLASYRFPDISVIVVSPDNFFSSAKVFEMIPNARSCLQTTVAPDDLVAVVEHYGQV